MIAERLRLYVNPMDAPGRAKAASETMQTLHTVLQEEEQSHAMDDVLRELERARMQREDFRSHFEERRALSTSSDEEDGVEMGSDPGIT